MREIIEERGVTVVSIARCKSADNKLKESEDQRGMSCPHVT